MIDAIIQRCATRGLAPHHQHIFYCLRSSTLGSIPSALIFNLSNKVEQQESSYMHPICISTHIAWT